MSKQKNIYQCEQCGAQTHKWLGQCAACQAWGSLVERPAGSGHRSSERHWVEKTAPRSLISVVSEDEHSRHPSGMAELDRVLGGGITPGSCVLLGGDPGIGKSTLLLQMLSRVHGVSKSLYVSGEESPHQLGMRATRLGLATPDCYVMSETALQAILEAVSSIQPQILVIDSIQTLYDETLSSASGSVAQIRECTHHLIRFCKQRTITLFIIGHVTKDGALAGPRVLEHMVDTVLYFEGERSSRHRFIRAIKNRFGPANEIGIFVMTQEGLKEVTHPSRMFLQEGACMPGRVVTALWEGSRAMLIELQVLTSRAYGDYPRRVCVGFDPGRLTLLLAVADRYLKLKLHELDVFVNVVGGIKITETSADLALIAAIISSCYDQTIPEHVMIFGEVGLGGEVRPVVEGQARVHTAHKQGFSDVLAPQRNQGKEACVAVAHIQDLWARIQGVKVS